MMTSCVIWLFPQGIDFELMIPMFDRVANFFRPEDAQKKASAALARLLSQYDMESIAYRSDITESRRRSESRPVALGCWIIPFEKRRPEILDFSSVTSAVTYDIRRNGLGLLKRESVGYSSFVVALPDKEGVWRFFECRMCHESNIPGGWKLLGLQIERTVEPDPRDVTLFRECIQDLNVPASSVMSRA
jgi:hypothetical protein